jgi:hypothetical protein
LGRPFELAFGLSNHKAHNNLTMQIFLVGYGTLGLLHVCFLGPFVLFVLQVEVKLCKNRIYFLWFG